MMTRRSSEHEVDAAVEASQIARDEARRTDPSWRLVEATDGLPGPVWAHPSPSDRAANLILEGERTADLILAIVRTRTVQED